MTQQEFERLRKRYVASVWKHGEKRGDLYDAIYRASNAKTALKAAKSYYRECLNFNRALEKFILRLEKSN